MQAGKGEPHVFKEKSFKKKRQCSVCRQTVDNVGSFCRGMYSRKFNSSTPVTSIVIIFCFPFILVCKTATHRKCEAKVRVVFIDLL